jgi:magnesium transporter
MDTLNVEQILSQLRVMLEHDKLDDAVRALQRLRAPDQADVLAELNPAEQIAIFPQLPPAKSADILEDMADHTAGQIITALPRETAVSIVDQMEPDEVADVLGSIPAPEAQAILTRLEDPDEVRPLLLHPDTSAGGIMTSEFLALRRRMTAADAIQAIRDWKPAIEAIYYLFVVDKSGRLCGVVNLRQLLVAEPKAPLSEIMDEDVISVHVGIDREECAKLMQRYDLLALPVVDDDNLLLGLITIDDVMDVLEAETTEDIQRLGGAQPLEKPYLGTNVFSVMRKRIGWLLLLFVTESLTGSVLRHFEGQLQSVVSLAYFVPLLIGTGGNAGSQTTSTIIRALAIGEVRLGDVLRAWWHEFRAGLMLGLAMGVVAFARALLWGSDMALAFAVATAIYVIVLWANSLGALLPILAARLKIDPTVVSGPVMSTLVDATGLFIYFSIARIILHI